MTIMKNLTEAAPATLNTPVVNQALALANAMNSQAGTSDLSQGQILNTTPSIPSSLTLTISSNNGDGALTKTVNVFNNSFLTQALTDNGSGAASISYTWGDGFSGTVYEQMFKFNGGQGILISGFTIISTNFTTGAQIATPFNTINMTLLAQNGNGASIPYNIKLAEALRNTQYQNGMLTPVVPFYINPLSQLQLSIPANTTIAFTFFTPTSSFRG